jgi:hypothetical protein
MYKLLVIGLLFLLGFYFIYKSNDIETFTNSDDKNNDYKIAEKCPDVLIQKGAAFFLYNSKRANVPGINPIRFDSLEEYVEFTDWQRSQGILCPVLYLQHAYNAQGEPVYKARPSPTNLQGGQPDFIVTPASLPLDVQARMLGTQSNMIPPPARVPIQGLYAPDAVYNVSGAQAQNSVPMHFDPMHFDPQNQTIGLDTPLDKMFHQTSGVSPNPMDSNWGGVEYTENLVKSGYYKGREVSKATLPV